MNAAPAECAVSADAYAPKLKLMGASMKSELLSKLILLAPAERIEIVHNLWDSISPGECPSLAAEFLDLTPEERIQLAMDLWDSIADEDLPRPTEEEIAELEREWAEHRRDPGSAIPWEEVRSWLWSRYA